MILLISRRPEGSGRVARHAYPGRSSIEPTTILLGKQKYRLIEIGLFTCRAIAGAKRHQVVKRGGVVVVVWGLVRHWAL
jgi:hypothetical protein